MNETRKNPSCVHACMGPNLPFCRITAIPSYPDDTSANRLSAVSIVGRDVLDMGKHYANKDGAPLAVPIITSSSICPVHLRL